MEIGPRSSAEEGKLGGDGRVNALRVMRLRICAKMPNVGLDPATQTPLGQTVTQLTKWSGGKHRQCLRPQNGTAARDGHRKNDPFRDTSRNGGPEIPEFSKSEEPQNPNNPKCK